MNNLVISPEWVVIGIQGLTGNILSSGSIGTGKSQGVILPFLDQILNNFEVRPSLLAIDPKNTFIPKAIDIIKKHGLEEYILHLTLKGNVTFNPIFVKDALKESRFLYIAQMIRAASANFMGSSGNSSFWDISSFNLVKNTLIYCAATLDYYTLNDLYNCMTRATENNISDELGKCIVDGKFEDEEVHNIKCAIEYFTQEYQQLDEKVRTGILATSTAFLNQFQEYRASKIFCPEKKDLLINSIDDVIDNGKLLLLDIHNPALARSMGTFIKLHYQQSILNRLQDGRGKERAAVIIMDEYQDVVSTGQGATLGDERFMAKSREAKAITIAATQSISSIQSSVGNDKATRELIQNFRTRILCQSTDMETIDNYQRLAGQYDKEKETHSISEQSQKTERNLIFGGFDISNANISESISRSNQKEHYVTAKEISRLKSFESYALIYDGIATSFHKLYLKPYFLEEKRTSHKKVLEILRTYAACLVFIFLGMREVKAYPNICSVVKTMDFNSCMNLTVKGDVCGFPFPRPCARVTYWVPETFLESVSNGGESFFSAMAGASVQLGAIKDRIPFGAEADNGNYSFHGHALQIPFSYLFSSILPCGGIEVERMCFSAMSEHISKHWRTGSADLLQPSFLAWMASPKACLIKGAISQAPLTPSGSYAGCSFPIPLPKYPPSTHPTCNGWGFFFPRSGTYEGASQVTGAAMIAARIKSIGSDVFKTVPQTLFEKWQMIIPNSSSCFREGENIASLEVVKRVNEWGRFKSGRPKNFLFGIWKRVSCKIDWPRVPVIHASLAIMKSVCAGGNL